MNLSYLVVVEAQSLKYLIIIKNKKKDNNMTIVVNLCFLFP